MSTSKAKDKPQSKPTSKHEKPSPEDSAPDGPNEDNGMVRVFVYGSLKQQMGNNVLLKQVGAKCLGYDTITGPFGMMSFGGFPGVVHTNSEIPTTIFGEVWATDEEGLAALDMLESHPNWYERFKYRTDILDRRAWMYTLPMGEGYLDPKRYDPVEHNIWRPDDLEIKFFNEQPDITLNVN